MINSYAKYSSSGTRLSDEDEENCETDEIKKTGTTSVFLLLTKNRKIQNIQQNTASKPCEFLLEKSTRRGE